MDITDIKHPDNTYDVIICSHVLEHIEDDRKAMKESDTTGKAGGLVNREPLKAVRKRWFASYYRPGTGRHGRHPAGFKPGSSAFCIWKIKNVDSGSEAPPE